MHANVDLYEKTSGAAWDGLGTVNLRRDVTQMTHGLEFKLIFLKGALNLFFFSPLAVQVFSPNK